MLAALANSSASYAGLGPVLLSVPSGDVTLKMTVTVRAAVLAAAQAEVVRELTDQPQSVPWLDPPGGRIS